MVFVLLSHLQIYMPFDCCTIISEFLPSIVCERCFMCGLSVVMKDKKGRMHFRQHIACTESIILCCECFEIYE